MRRNPSPSVRESLLVAALFGAWTWLQFAPALGARLSGRIGPDLGDPVLNLYFLKWAAHQLAHGLPDLWNAPFFFPTLGALTLSDHLLVPGAALLALGWVGIPAVAAYNLLVLFSFAASAWSAWWVARRTGLGPAGALVTGVAFAFSSFHWSELSHFQTLRMQWIPLLFWSFDRLLERPRAGRALLFVALYLAHIGGGAYLAVMAHVGLLALLLNRWREIGAGLRSRRTLTTWATAALAALALAGLLYAPYVGQTGGQNRPRIFSEVRHYSATLLSYLEPSRRSITAALLPGWPPRDAAATLFPGVAVSILLGIALRTLLRRYATPCVRPSKATAAAVATGSLLVALGLLAADRVTLGADAVRSSLLAPLAAYGYRGALWTVAGGGVMVVAALRRRHGGPWLRWHEMAPWPRGLALCGLAGVAFSLPLFFWLLWSALPPFHSMRVPWRIVAVAALPLAMLAGFGFDQLIRPGARTTRRRGIAIALGALLVLESIALLPSWQKLPERRDFPAYAKWIAGQAAVTAYIELPLPPGDLLYRETLPMYFQSEHWKPIGNGFSAAIPNSFRKIEALCRPLPDTQGLEALRADGFTHLVVHWQEFVDARLAGRALRRAERSAAERQADWENQVASAGVAREFEGDGVAVYSLGSPTAGD